VRILLVGPYPIDSAAVGGLQASFANLVLGLAELPQVDPHVISFVPGLERATRRNVGDVPVDYLPGSHRFGFLTRHGRERRSLEEMLRTLSPDVVHAQDTLGSGYTCLKAVHGIPVVVSVHGIVRESVKHMPNGSDRLRLKMFGVPVERYCIRHARYLVQPTRYPERYFGREIRGQIVEVGNPISESFFSVHPAPEPGVILYGGGVISLKRLLDLVEAMPLILAVVPDARLRVAGSELDTAYARRVRGRVHELGLEARVAFLGALSPDEMVGQYRRASMLVLPSMQETSPMVIGEAMAAGLPVVATRVGGVPYLVDDGVTGHVVDAGDVVSLAARIADLLGDPDKRAAFGAAGRAKADRSFRRTAVAARVAAVYEELRDVRSHH
jgi:glycosyltransferase involved in cell wall biosynthesis